MKTRTTSAQTAPLRGARKARGRSLRQVAGQVGVDAAHLSRIERGLALPSVTLLHRLAVELELRELARFLAPYDR